MTRYPTRLTVPWEVDEGRAVLEPPDTTGRVERWFRRILRAPRRRQVRLDEEGTRAWLLADGTRTLDEVAEALARELGSDAHVDRARARVGTFYGMLRERGVLELRGEPEPVTDPLRGFPHHEEVTCGCGRTVRVPAGRDGPVRYRCPTCGTRHVADLPPGTSDGRGATP